MDVTVMSRHDHIRDPGRRGLPRTNRSHFPDAYYLRVSCSVSPPLFPRRIACPYTPCLPRALPTDTLDSPSCAQEKRYSILTITLCRLRPSCRFRRWCFVPPMSLLCMGVIVLAHPSNVYWPSRRPVSGSPSLVKPWSLPSPLNGS